jgi:hypothetical protein
MFSLKYPSLLQFDEERNVGILKHNLKTLFQVEQAPSDTQMRERLDEVDPAWIRKPYKEIFAEVQRGKGLEQYQYLEDKYLVSMDGTGCFSSDTVHCDNCCVKEHANGKKTYYHQILGLAIVHPEHKFVIPFAPEPIIKQDGQSKNDCERNAGKRVLEDLKREHPHLKLIIVEDGLASNMPHIETIKSMGYSFILGAKPGDHKFLFDWIEGEYCTEYEKVDKEGTLHKFRFINGAPLNEKNFGCKVNFLEYWELKKDGSEQHFSWVTDLLITKENVFKIMRGGRARWRIENETFNTLKNQGYQFERNFGHGYRNLSTIFSMLMMLAFLVDQTQALCCDLFQKAVVYTKRKIKLWERLRNIFGLFLCDSWETVFKFLATEAPLTMALRLQANTS